MLVAVCSALYFIPCFFVAGLFVWVKNKMSSKPDLRTIELPDMSPYADRLNSSDFILLRGRVQRVVGLTIESMGPSVNIGEVCRLRGKGLRAYGPAEQGSACREGEVLAEVVGFKDDRVLLMPFGNVGGIGMNTEVLACNESFSVKVGKALLGRVIDGLGRPIDDLGGIWTSDIRPVHATPINPMYRSRIKEPIGTGIRAIDGLITCGKGQRVGIFAGSGVGKSVLMGTIAKHSEADVNVIGLIGERGREVKEFIENDLGPEGLGRSVVVAATSDQPALVRRQGAYIATTIAEYFRDLGMNVMLMIDSVTRFAMAQREIGLAVGEPPTAKGYTPSVFAQLPLLMERAGASGEDGGSITALYTVLVDADDFNEPISDAARSILDGHIILSRDLASKGHYPAIDVLSSLSRLMTQITPKEHVEVAILLRRVLAVYKDAEDLINLGAYARGSNNEIDYAISVIDKVRAYLQQSMLESTTYKTNIDTLMALLN